LTADHHAENQATDLIECSTHSFIVKIWLEETPEESSHPLWRGHITHVPSGKRHYFSSLERILSFIVPYLRSIGIKFGLTWRLREQLDKWTAYRKNRSSRRTELEEEQGGRLLHKP
jgi:hypothetical protein